jgi:polysaccharide biosynthesis/export protein
MPVRSRGSLLAGTVALASLVMAGAGCQSHPSDHDAFASPNTGQITSGLFSRHGDRAIIASTPSQPVAGFAPTSSAVQGPGPVTFQSVPVSAPAGNRAVIASSWQPVQRVSAEQTVFGPELNGGAPAALPISNGRLLPVRSPVGAPMPIGSPSGVFIGSGPVLDDTHGEAAPSIGANTLHQPRVMGAPPAMMYAGPMPSAHSLGAPSMPREFEKQALPPYVVEPPDILLIQASDNVTLRLQRIEGQHLVAPDGTINLGIYGKIRVVGMTVEQVSDAVAARLLEIMPGLSKNMKAVDAEGKELKTEIGGSVWKETFSGTAMIKKELQVDVLSYNSKYYYVITDGGGYGQQVYPILITGNETVLDAIAKVNGLPAVSSKKKIWVARATRAGQAPKVLPVDWKGVTECGSGTTNYQIFPGDRVYVQSDGWIRADTWLSKRLSPILRGFGATLLGASTVNSIKNGTSSGLGGLSGLSGIR